MALKFFNKCKRAAPPCKHRDSPSDTASVKHRTPAVIRTASPFGGGAPPKVHSFSNTEGRAVSGATRSSRPHGEVPPL